MNKFAMYAGSVLIASLLFFLFVGTRPPVEETPIALVKKVVRDVNQRTDSESDWQLAAKGERLYDGGEVKTGANSLALVLFTDGSGLLRVRENSIANIYGKREKNNFSNNSVIHKGKVGFEITKQRENEEFTFTTPTMVASIRGTSGLILVEEIGASLGEESNNETSHKTTLIVEEGVIEVESTKGEKNKSTVSAGQALISDDAGQFKSGKISIEQNKILKSSKATKQKKVRFTVNGVQYEVEYYTEEE